MSDGQHMTADDWRKVRDVLRDAERRAEENAAFAIQHGYGDDPLAGDEASEIYMHGQFKERARELYRLRVLLAEQEAAAVPREEDR